MRQLLSLPVATWGSGFQQTGRGPVFYGEMLDICAAVWKMTAFDFLGTGRIVRNGGWLFRIQSETTRTGSASVL